MNLIKIIFFIMALTLTLTPSNSQPAFLERKPAAPKRVSRFLQGINNPRAAHNCNKDNVVCSMGGRSATCCNNRCVETGYDSNNCGACGKKCAFAQACCRGECVNLAYDKKHCGFCNNMCTIGDNDGNCLYGVCDYAV